MPLDAQPVLGVCVALPMYMSILRALPIAVSNAS